MSKEEKGKILEEGELESSNEVPSKDGADTKDISEALNNSVKTDDGTYLEHEVKTKESERISYKEDEIEVIEE